MTIANEMIAAVAAAVALVAALIVWQMRRARSTPHRIRKLVSRLSLDALVNVAIPDGLGGEIHIDHLLLTPRGLLLLDFKDLSGAVFAGVKLDQWSAGESTRRFMFENPLPLLQSRAEAVAALANGVPIESRVVFTGDVDFPKGHPASVTSLAALSEQDIPDDGDVGLFRAQWEVIKAAAYDF